MVMTNSRQARTLAPATASSSRRGEASAAWIGYLAEAVRWAPSADNSQPWELAVCGDRLVLQVAGARASLGARHPAVLLSLGAAGENLAQAAAAAGLDTATWQWRWTPTPALVLPFPDTGRPPSDLPPALRARHTNRAPYRCDRLPPALAARIRSQGTERVQVHWIEDRVKIRHLGRLVGRAARLRYRDEGLHRWLAHSLRFSAEAAERGEGLDVRTLHLPPGGRQVLRLVCDWRRMRWLNALGADRMLGAFEGFELVRCGALVAIGTPAPPVLEDWVAAGRVLERVWLELNAAGAAVHPSFVLPDLLHRLATTAVPAALEAAARDVAAAFRAAWPDGGFPCMLLRTGYARPPAVRARRLPLERILTQGNCTDDDDALVL